MVSGRAGRFETIPPVAESINSYLLSSYLLTLRGLKKTARPFGKPSLLWMYEIVQSMYPLAHSSSARRTAPPAAPRRVLWERPTNL